MKIGIDCRMASSNFGIGRYIQQLMIHLLEIDKENQYVFFKPDIPWYGWKEQLMFKKIIEKEKVDLMHFPHWNVPVLYNAPFVVTIHDLTMYHYPRPEATTLGPIKFWFKEGVHRLVVRRAVRQAEKIIVTSEFTKEDVHQTLGVPMEKMVVTYQAPFEKLQITRSPCHARHCGQANYKLQIGGPYVLYVGSAYPHKNLKGLLAAWKIFEDKRGNGYKLVLVGRQSYFYDNLKPAISDFQSVIHLDSVDDDELVSLYQNADLFIFPSLYEGFGLPPLEAMSRGALVVSSNRSCLPEILGEAALYFDPENHEQMADMIHRGLADNNARFTLKNNARELLAGYSWRKLAQKTIDIYADVLRARDCAENVL